MWLVDFEGDGESYHFVYLMYLSLTSSDFLLDISNLTGHRLNKIIFLRQILFKLEVFLFEFGQRLVTICGHIFQTGNLQIKKSEMAMKVRLFIVHFACFLKNLRNGLGFLAAYFHLSTDGFPN